MVDNSEQGAYHKIMRVRRNSRPYTLLKYLATGSGVLILSMVAPLSGAQIVKALVVGYIRQKRFEKDRFLRDLKSLQKRSLVNYRELDSGRVEITLTKMGKEKMLTYQLDDMRLEKPARWDGTWRLIMFDIPHSEKTARDVFRRKLNDLKFHPLQKSVFITPYSCEDEIDFIASIFDIRKFVLILYVSHFEGEEKLRHPFGL